jgi:sugar phosphate isomerase/epimerase
MLKVGVTTGLFFIAHAEELASTVKKIGYGLTRGSDVIEISGDTPHEITETEGEECRNLAEKQGIDLLFHGSLTVPLEIPERSDWRDAHDHMQKSVRSAVHSGCKYCLFHACLHFWLEMITYASHKLEIVMCDHLGQPLSEILYENEKLRKWFIIKMWEFERNYATLILSEDELREAEGKAHVERGELYVRDKIEEHVRKDKNLMAKVRVIIRAEIMENVRIARARGQQIPDSEVERMVDEKVRTVNYRQLEGIPAVQDDIKKIEKQVVEEASLERSKIMKERINEFVLKKMLKKDRKERKWRVETYGRYTDAYMTIAHYMFYRKDPVFVEMVKMYKELVVDKYKLDYSNDYWLDEAWRRAEETNDREFKTFYYATVGAKFLEGHVKNLLEWLEGDYIKKELAGKPELIKIAKELKITFEIPDARDPKYAGLYILWHPKQLYAAIKTIRRTLNTGRIFITEDFEHMATQGIDPVIELDKITKIAPDMGEYVLSVHSNTPNPLHSHYPIELGDIPLYKCMWALRRTGMGRKHTVYFLFERGGFQDPFKQSVDALKLVAKFLERDTPPDALPPEFFGIELTAGDVVRQEQIMRDHRFDPLQDLLETPEEEWGLLSSAATRKGKTKEFKKGEMR